MGYAIWNDAFKIRNDGFHVCRSFGRRCRKACRDFTDLGLRAHRFFAQGCEMLFDPLCGAVGPFGVFRIFHFGISLTC